MTPITYHSYLYSWHGLSCYPSFQLSCFHWLCCYYARAVLFTHTHTLIRSLLTTLDSHVQGIGHLLILFRCSCDRTLCEEVGVSPFWFWYSCISLFLLLFLNSCISHLASFHSIFHLRSCVAFICIIAVIVDYYGSDLYLIQVTLGLACIHEVYSLRIYVVDLRDSVSSCFGKRGVTGFSWYQSQVRHKTDLILTGNLNEL